MSTIVLSNLNPTVLEKLQVLSQKHNRTVEEEITAIITEVAETEDVNFKSSRQMFWDKLEKARLQHGNKIFSDSVEFLREDRQR